MNRRPAAWVSALDCVAAAFAVIGAVFLAIIAISGNAGPFGAAVVFPAAMLLCSLVVGIVAVVARLRLRGAEKTRRWVLAATVSVAVAFALFPASAALRDRGDARRFEELTDRLVAVAQRCSEEAVARVDDEVETNPGVEIRPRMTNNAVRCVERAEVDRRLTCAAYSCYVTVDRPAVDGHRTVGVDLRTFLDKSLRAADRPPYDRTPQPAAPSPDPDGVWFD